MILCDEPTSSASTWWPELDTRIDRIAAQLAWKGYKGMEEARRRVLDSDYTQRSAYHTYLSSTRTGTIRSFTTWS